ncbi:hypothetical protein DMUE_1692 [Dictyocoela muelleri]|nr:hypothetical protein DMUE_1692 [Dictyocoela muelleri]
MESSRRNLIITICISAAMLLGIIVFIMYGASIVSEINEKQIVMIKESENLQKLKKIIDTFFNKPADYGGNINCFIFTNKIFIFINKNIPDFEYLNNDELENMESNIIISPEQFVKKLIEAGLMPPSQKFQINFDFVTDEKLVKDNSWSGYFYRCVGGQFIPDTITDISNYLQKSKEEIGEEKVGVCLLNEVIYLFTRREDDSDFEIMTKIYGYGDKITPLEILLYLFKIDP